jgi:ribosome-associated heat shock protein Hsp15
MRENNNVRIDKFLCAVRIFKTRSIAADECRKGRIYVNNVQVKPSGIVAKNDIIIVKKLPVLYTFKVIEPVDKRISAKLVPEYLSDLTSEEEKVKLSIKNYERSGYRVKGTGRPTKKERRIIDKLEDDLNIK